MEIERKFLIKELPENLSSYKCLVIEQAYLCTEPVVRIRRQDEDYYLTYKGGGLMSREEYNLPLTEKAYEHLLTKADGNIISKKRYLIPISNPVFRNDYTVPKKNVDLKIELDIFDPHFAPLILTEEELSDKEMALAFIPPPSLCKDVTDNPKYHNSNMSRRVFRL